MILLAELVNRKDGTWGGGQMSPKREKILRSDSSERKSCSLDELSLHDLTGKVAN